MSGQTIADAAAQSAAGPESLLAFLMKLPFTMEAQQFYALLASGSIGILANYFRKWLTKEIEGNLWVYLFEQNVRGTLLSFAGYLGVAIAAISAKAFTVGDPAMFVGWGVVLWNGVSNGFMIDAILNKSQRAVWTKEQRQVEGLAPTANVVQPTERT